MAHKSLIAPRVINTAKFMGMSLEARALYPHLLNESDPIGVLTNVEYAAQGFNIPDSQRAIGELERFGYLLRFAADDGEPAWLIAHWFQHNSHNPKKEATSAYYDEVRKRFVEDGSKCYQAINRPESGQNQAENRPNTIEGNVTERNVTEPNSRQANETERMGPVSCSECGSYSAYRGSSTNGWTQYECTECQAIYWVNDATGEVGRNPYAMR